MASIPGPDISDFPVVDGVNVPAMTAWVSPMAPQQVVPGTGFYSCSIKSRPHSGQQ